VFFFPPDRSKDFPPVPFCEPEAFQGVYLLKCGLSVGPYSFFAFAGFFFCLLIVTLAARHTFWRHYTALPFVHDLSLDNCPLFCVSVFPGRILYSSYARLLPLLNGVAPSVYHPPYYGGTALEVFSDFATSYRENLERGGAHRFPLF